MATRRSTKRAVSVTTRLRARRMTVDSSSEDSESEDEQEASKGFCSPHLVIAILLTLLSGGVWGVGAYFGIVQRPSQRLEAVRNASHGRLWPWQTRTAENSFAAFDRDHDGFFGAEDLAHLAPKTSALERKKFIGLADHDRDGVLSEAEYLELVRMEREHRAKQGGGALGGATHARPPPPPA